MVAWPPVTVAWPSSDFFQNFPKSLETSKKTLFDSRPTVAWPEPLSRDRSAILFKIFPNRFERPKNVVWQSADGRVTSDHCRVTVQRLFSKFSQIAWNVQKTLFDSRPTVAWPRPLSRDRSATFIKIFPNRFERPKNVVWQSADGRVTSDHCRVTVQWLFSKKFLIAWNVEKTLFDSRPTVAWPPTTVAWPFSDFFQKFFQLLNTSENSCLTVSRRSRHLRLGWKVEQILFESQRTVTWRTGYFVPVVFFRTASHTASQMYISLLLLLYFFSAKSKATYLLLQEWSDPGNFDIISKLGIGRREFLILAGKFQLIDSLWGK